jgi:DNA-binding Xre family transcriptional regulator
MLDAGTMTATVVRRRCRGCGRPLSQYNPEKSCRACVTGTNESPRPVYESQKVHPLRRARLRRGMTLETLAGLSGLSAATLSRVENGQRELCRKSHITALAAALRVPPVDLVPWVLAPPE